MRCILCVLLCLRAQFGAAQPNFPNGVAPIMRSIDMRAGALPMDDDKKTVAALMREGVQSLSEDLIEEGLQQDLKQSAYTRVHQHVLRKLFVGGCTRNFTGCPSGWLDSQGSCEPPAEYTGLCAGYKGFTAAQKETFAWKCRASWPCADACAKDFTNCPATWVSVGEGSRFSNSFALTPRLVLVVDSRFTSGEPCGNMPCMRRRMRSSRRL